MPAMRLLVWRRPEAPESTGAIRDPTVGNASPKQGPEFSFEARVSRPQPSRMPLEGQPTCKSFFRFL